MIQEKSIVYKNEHLQNAYYRIGIHCGPGYSATLPGQFVTLRLPQYTSPLLRRPFSIHRVLMENGKAKGIELLYKVVGEFTRNLSHVKKNDPIDLLGPLGQGHTILPDVEKIAILGGGIGIAPLVFLVEALRLTGADLSHSMVCIGGRSKSDILCKEIFTSSGLTVNITTEDGSAGEQGLVTRPLNRWLETNTPDMIYACGPMPMLKAVADIANERDLPCEVSIETIMACGLGACLGCAVKTKDVSDNYKHVCLDGPVFDAREFIF